MFRILILLIFAIKSFIIFSQNSSSETYIKDIEGQIYKTAVIGGVLQKQINIMLGIVF